LLYAVANTDGKISNKEKAELKTIVRDELVPAEKHIDHFGTDAAYYTEIEFDILEETMADPQAAFDSFISYIETHHSAIDARMRDISLKIAKRIAATYHNTSNKEKELIKTRLKLLPA
jgi:hypothetical protein